MSSNERPEPTDRDKLIERLNARVSKRLSERTGSFFFPELNGSDDPNGLKAFKAGDLGPTDQFIEAVLAQKGAENEAEEQNPQAPED